MRAGVTSGEFGVFRFEFWVEWGACCFVGGRECDRVSPTKAEGKSKWDWERRLRSVWRKAGVTGEAAGWRTGPRESGRVCEQAECSGDSSRYS
jgi:hypothetical protein